MSVRMDREMNSFAECGKNVTIGWRSTFQFENIHKGNSVAIAYGASFIATRAKIYIGNYVMFGPNVTIRGGNHMIDYVGKFMFDVNEKLPENDQDVIIFDDVWVGCNAITLKGVQIDR